MAWTAEPPAAAFGSQRSCSRMPVWWRPSSFQSLQQPRSRRVQTLAPSSLTDSRLAGWQLGGVSYDSLWVRPGCNQA